MPFYAGKGGFFTINNASFPMDTWSISVDVDEVEVTNFQSQGFKSLIAGVQGGSVTASGPYNGSSIIPGVLAAFTFGLSTIPQVSLSPPIQLGVFQALITSVKIDTSVKEKATIEVTASLAANLG
jgi:hypothetical protein